MNETAHPDITSLVIICTQAEWYDWEHQSDPLVSLIGQRQDRATSSGHLKDYLYPDRQIYSPLDLAVVFPSLECKQTYEGLMRHTNGWPKTFTFETNIPQDPVKALPLFPSTSPFHAISPHQTWMPAETHPQGPRPYVQHIQRLGQFTTFQMEAILNRNPISPCNIITFQLLPQ